jgi:hypothetical protein
MADAEADRGKHGALLYRSELLCVEDSRSCRSCQQ